MTEGETYRKGASADAQRDQSLLQREEGPGLENIELKIQHTKLLDLFLQIGINYFEFKLSTLFREMWPCIHTCRVVSLFCVLSSDWTHGERTLDSFVQ